MATYPIKMLKDEEGKPFVPLINIDAIKELGGDSLMETIEGKLEVTNIIAGRQIDLDIDGNNITINNSSEGTKLINNLDTTTAGTGALDAAQGKVLKDSIPEVINNLTTIDSKKALSAHQGYILAGRSVPVGGGTGQVLMKSADDDYSLTWGDAADPNAIVGDGSIKKIVELTYDEYVTLEEAGKLESTTEYHISDMNEQGGTYITETEIQDMIESNVVNNLTTSSGNQALSAAQGKILNDKIPVVENSLTSTNTDRALSAAQGRELSLTKQNVLEHGRIHASQFTEYTFGGSDTYCYYEYYFKQNYSEIPVVVCSTSNSLDKGYYGNIPTHVAEITKQKCVFILPVQKLDVYFNFIVLPV